MSIKRKFAICLVVMLIIPVALILLLSLCLLAAFALLHPSIEFSLANGLEISDPIVMKFIIIWSIMAILVIVSTGIAIAAYLSKSILRPIQEITLAMEHMTNGDLTYEFAGSEDAELRELCSSFEALRLRLQQNVAENLCHEQEQRMLIANISHDIKTPVTSIRGYVEGIMEGIADTPEKLDRYLKTIHQKASAIETMADNLSLYSKLEMKKLPYHMKNQDIFAFLRETIREFELDLQDNNMTLSYDIPKTPCLVRFDAEKLRRVCSNVIINAMKYKSGKSDALHVSGQETQHGVLISFSDNGIGIAPEEQEKVFEGFYRSDPSRNNKIEGNGLGLAICRQIMTAHNGKIWIRSEPNAGTDVILLLPPAKAQDKI